jgi:hypothetical protein
VSWNSLFEVDIITVWRWYCCIQEKGRSPKDSNNTKCSQTPELKKAKEDSRRLLLSSEFSSGAEHDDRSSNGCPQHKRKRQLSDHSKGLSSEKLFRARSHVTEQTPRLS